MWFKSRSQKISRGKEIGFDLHSIYWQRWKCVLITFDERKSSISCETCGDEILVSESFLRLRHLMYVSENDRSKSTNKLVKFYSVCLTCLTLCSSDWLSSSCSYENLTYLGLTIATLDLLLFNVIHTSSLHK